MIIIRTIKKILLLCLAIIISAIALSFPYIADEKWGALGINLITIVIFLYCLILSCQVALFREQGFTLMICLYRKKHYSYEDIEKVYITTVIREGKKPEKWIVLRPVEQSFNQISYQNLESFASGIPIISFPYSERREEIMDRFFAGKKKYAILHDSTGVFEETEPS